MIAIKTRNLVKQYKNILAVDNVDLEIEAGECFGLLGPNGAGKTTIIRMITAISPPTGGSIRVLGKELRTHAREVKANLGVVPQLDNLDPDLTVLQNLLAFSRYFSIPKNEAKRRSMEVLTLFELQSRCKSEINELSGGMKRRLLLARGLINNPRIMILDEPTVGLDPQAKHLVWNKLQELKSKGVTQLLSTQNMEEAESLCDRVAIMNQGKIMDVDAPVSLISKYVGVQIAEAKVDSADRDLIIGKLNDNKIEFEYVREDCVNIFHIVNIDQIKRILNSKLELKTRPATLEDVFFRITGRSLTE